MRILFVSNIFPNPIHATKGTFNLEMLRALARLHEVRVVSPIPWVQELPLIGRALRANERRVTVDRIDVHYPRYYYTPRIGRRFYGDFYWHSVKQTALRVAREQQPDVVLSYWAHPDGDAATRLAETLGVPSVIMIGGSDVLLFTSNPTRRTLIVNSLLRTDRILTVSEHLRQSMAAFGVPSSRISVIYRGVDLERFRPGSREQARDVLGIPHELRTGVWVGRMVPVKGLETLIDAAARARAAGARFRVYLLGEGPLRAKLEAQVARLGLGDVVSFVGSVAHRDLPTWYRAADVTVLPSLSEGVPNVLLESIACGTPFIASSVGGIPEIADERFDRLVPPADAATLADALAAIGRPDSAQEVTRRFMPRDANSVSADIAAVLSGTCTRRATHTAVVATPVPQVH